MDIDIKERLSLFGIRDSDKPVIKSLSTLLQPHLDDVLKRFYETAFSIPEAAKMFDDKEMIARTQSAQKNHWLKMMNGEFDQAYLESCQRIGAVHHKIKLPFLHYLSAYARATADLQACLIKSLGRFSSLKPKKLETYLGVLHRITALDTELVINAYFSESQPELLETSFNYIGQAVAKLAAGKINCQLDSRSAPDFPQKFADLQLSWNEGIDSLQTVIGAIDSTMGEVKTTTLKIEEEAGGLATRAENQAASLEETNAAMQLLAEGVKSTADTSKRMETVTGQARNEMTNGSKVMTEAASAMQRISNASEEITKIIGLIDDISFQTNLLALNAGVEAARAGEAGRGFAVVASEVRNLAASSSNAAKQIKDLIGKSAEEVSSGVQLVDSANGILSRIVETFNEVAELTQTVSEAASDQFSNLKEVSAAVADMDTITQRNAGMAHSTTERVKTLVSATERLTSQLSHFDLEENPQPMRRRSAA